MRSCASCSQDKNTRPLISVSRQAYMVTEKVKAMSNLYAYLGKSARTCRRGRSITFDKSHQTCCDRTISLTVALALFRRKDSTNERFLRGRNSIAGKDVSYREDGLCVAELLDGEVSSGSLGWHSQSATPFCQTEGKESGGKQGGQRVLGTPGFPPWSPQGTPCPSTAADFQFFFQLHATSSRSNSLLRPPPLPPPSHPPLPCLRLPSPPSVPSSCLPSSFSLASRLCLPISLWPLSSSNQTFVRGCRVEANSQNPDWEST